MWRRAVGLSVMLAVSTGAQVIFDPYPSATPLRLTHPSLPADIGPRVRLAPGGLVRVDGLPSTTRLGAPLEAAGPVRLRLPDGRQWTLAEERIVIPVPASPIPYFLGIPVIPIGPAIIPMPIGAVESSVPPRPRFVKLPEDLPLGRAEAVFEDGSTQPLDIVRRSFGFFESGRQVGGGPLRSTRALTPWSVVTLEGSGLGQQPEMAEIYVTFSTLDHSRAVRASGRRSATQTGVDIVEFTVPPGLWPSCALRTDLWVDGTWSLLSTRVPVAMEGAARCPESAPFDVADVDRAEAGETLPVATFRFNTERHAMPPAPSAVQFSFISALNALRVPRDSIPVQAPGTCSLRERDPFFELDLEASRNRLILDPGTGGLASFLLGGQRVDLWLEAKVRDDQGGVFYERGAPTSDRVPGGPWVVETALGRHPVRPLMLNRLDDARVMPSLDRGYVVEWDTAALEAGDRAEFLLSAPGDRAPVYLACAADARMGTIRVPPSLIREFSQGLSGERVRAEIRLVRARDVRSQPGNSRARYVIIEQKASDWRFVLLP